MRKKHFGANFYMFCPTAECLLFLLHFKCFLFVFHLGKAAPKRASNKIYTFLLVYAMFDFKYSQPISNKSQYLVFFLVKNRKKTCTIFKNSYTQPFKDRMIRFSYLYRDNNLSY